MGKPRVRWLRLPLLKLSSNFRRCPFSKKSLLIASGCVVYLFLVVSHVGNSQPRHRDRRIGEDGNRRARGPDHRVDAQPESAGPSDAAPTRSNVVYITLRSKRMKPAHIRGTVRPKLRRKAKRTKATNAPITQNKLDSAELETGASWREISDARYKPLDLIQSSHDREAGTQASSIRIYSQRAPPWFSAQDLKTMRFLADAKVLRVREISRGGVPPLLMFEGETTAPLTNHKHSKRSAACGGQCGIIRSPVDNTEVFAFHLDRVLRLNRTPPAVSRKFSFLHDGQSCPVVSWDASLHSEANPTHLDTVRLTWGEYQNSLKQRCWQKNISPKPDSGCSTIHHHEWSKLALFDFLLQIHSRLDQSCCGFRPRQEDVCVEPGYRVACGDQDNLQLANIVHRKHEPRRLVFSSNKGFFDRNEDNLDFKLLEGIKEFPEQAMSVLRGRKLREKLLQSLFLDETFWESQGGRQGIDKLIDVIERRSNVLLTYINAHGIKVIAMDA
ncbi:Golgi-associated kinase 1B [Cololabis saira]|uniref:Golgi-associated kinase 1B n=1 Tax=Cololabis saira TaxID=129043 RepID=UPI002AD51F87|nr:Golgi-associated kinase 1B [Cololabis saira]